MADLDSVVNKPDKVTALKGLHFDDRKQCTSNQVRKFKNGMPALVITSTLKDHEDWKQTTMSRSASCNIIHLLMTFLSCGRKPHPLKGVISPLHSSVVE